MQRHIISVVIFLLAISFLSPQTAYSQGKKHVLIFETMAVPIILEGSQLFRQGMAEIGYRPGIDIEYKIINAEGDRVLGKKLLTAAITERKPDLVISLATMASIITYEELKDTDIPWLFFTVTDPVGAGIVARENEPSGKNVSGLIYGVDRSIRLQLVKRLLEGTDTKFPIRLGLIHSDYPSSLSEQKMLQKAVDSSKAFQLVSHQLNYQPIPEKLDSLLQEVRSASIELADQVDFWWSPTGPLGERDEYVRLLLEETEKPIVIATNMRGVEAGALLYVGPSIPGQSMEIAVLADQVLRGKPVGDIPVTLPKVMSVGLNLRTAAEMKIIIPSDILKLAEGNIYR